MNNSSTTDQCFMDKFMRSVIVRNIPYQATEEKLRVIFSAVGPVESFKLAFDRETGEPEDYGFCVYKDENSALSAMRNMNGYEIGGRALRVDNAFTEKSQMEMESLLLQGQNRKYPYDELVLADETSAAISRAVALLPEQIFELMEGINSFGGNSRTDRFPKDIRDRFPVYTMLAAPVASASPIVGTTASTGISSTSSNSERLMAETSSAGNTPIGAIDQERAALIVQVLQLSDEQIAMLPLVKRQQILVLKDQINKSRLHFS